MTRQEAGEIGLTLTGIYFVFKGVQPLSDLVGMVAMLTDALADKDHFNASNISFVVWSFVSIVVFLVVPAGGVMLILKRRSWSRRLFAGDDDRSGDLSHEKNAPSATPDPSSPAASSTSSTATQASSASVARAPGATPSPPRPPAPPAAHASLSDVQAVAFAVLGLYLLLTGLTRSGYTLTHIAAILSTDMFDLDLRTWLEVAIAFLQVLIGLGLFLGARGLANLWWKLRTGGVRYADRNESAS